MIQTNTSENKLDTFHLVVNNYFEKYIHSNQSEGFRKTVDTLLCGNLLLKKDMIERNI